MFTPENDEGSHYCAICASIGRYFACCTQHPARANCFMCLSLKAHFDKQIALTDSAWETRIAELQRGLGYLQGPSSAFHAGQNDAIGIEAASTDQNPQSETDQEIKCKICAKIGRKLACCINITREDGCGSCALFFALLECESQEVERRLKDAHAEEIELLDSQALHQHANELAEKEAQWKLGEEKTLEALEALYQDRLESLEALYEERSKDEIASKDASWEVRLASEIAALDATWAARYSELENDNSSKSNTGTANDQTEPNAGKASSASSEKNRDINDHIEALRQQFQELDDKNKQLEKRLEQLKARKRELIELQPTPVAEPLPYAIKQAKPKGKGRHKSVDVKNGVQRDAGDA